jgi:DNA-binding response OmpR family regulator
MHAQRKRTVLVIEDEEVMRKVLADNFSADGFEVSTAENGNEGLSTALVEKPDLLLLDNRMPGMSGFEMLRRLRETGAWGEQVPVIFFSNIEPATREERADIASTGASYYLLKVNTSMDELLAKAHALTDMQK